ncbi:MAG: GTP cyclohydrolase I, partial [Puniceicoccales bacterium]|nr:GTP cyclohydrolase I [Puniceicoccales bacterium]
MNKDKVREAIGMLLEGLGKDISDKGLMNTPRRVVEMLECFSKTSGIVDEEIFDTTFSIEHYDEFILMKNIKFSSFCEHHLLPFFGSVSICYIPAKGVVT